MSRTYRAIGKWHINMLEDDERWAKPEQRIHTFRYCKYLGNGEWGPLEEHTRVINPTNFVPYNVRAFKLRPGRRPVGRDGFVNPGCMCCSPSKVHAMENKRFRLRVKEMIRKGQWEDLPLRKDNDWCW